MSAYKSVLLQGNQLEKNHIRESGSGFICLPGYFHGKQTVLPVSEEDLSKHTLMLGGTGTGKTNAMYHYVGQIKKQMTSEDVMIIFDTKGDFVRKFYESQDCIISTNRAYEKQCSFWNIYKEIAADGWEKDTLEMNAREIARAIFQETIEKNNAQPFFSHAACDLLTAVLLAHFSILKGDRNAMNRYLNNEALKQYLNQMTAETLWDLLKEEEDLKSVLTYLGDGTSEQGMGVLSELQSVVRRLFVGAFAKTGGFSMRNFVRKRGGRTVFMEYDLTLGGALTPVYRLLFDLALKEAMGRSGTEGNVYMVCDEFKLLPNLEHIEDAVNFGRSLGVKVLAGIQSISQLYEIYGERRGRNIAAGFSSLFSFRLNDPESRAYISGLYGENMILEQYRGLANTITEEKRMGKTIEDWELVSLKQGEAIVGLPFAAPFRFQFDLYKG